MLHQTKTAKGLNTPPVPYQAGQEMVATFEHTFNDAFTTATDKIELGVLPGGAILTGATVIGEGLGVATANVGFMSGEPGDKDDTRTVGTEFFSAQSVNDTEQAMTAAAAKGIAPDNAHRGIGATVSADVAASAAKKLTLVIRYTY
jgi:hypothetical protein